MSTAAPKSWTDLLATYLGYFDRQFGELQPPATTEKERAALEQFAASRGLMVPQTYLDLLTIVNGTSSDGLVFYGAGIPLEDSFGRLDFERTNALLERTDGLTIYGEWNGEVFIYDGKQFGRSDAAALQSVVAFESFDAMLTAVLLEEVAGLTS